MMSDSQLSFFEPPIGTKNTGSWEKISADLDKLNALSTALERHLHKMVTDIQKDWSEDEKLMVNNPKEYYKKQNDEIKSKAMPKELSSQAIEVLKNCIVENTVVKLPAGQLDRSIYLEVKTRLELIGGKWKGGKIAGFVFVADPSDLLQKIAGGDKVNLKKEFQFFATPAELADQLVQLAGINEGDCVLEPSAGQGAIIAAIYRRFPRIMMGPNDDPCVTVDYFELMPVNQAVLSKKINSDQNWGSRTSCMGDDFLASKNELYPRIIANPPFSGNQDIAHVWVMYTKLKPGGRMVSIVSKHWENSANRTEREFRQFLADKKAEIIQIPAGSFKESGTNISACIIVIDK